MGVLSFLKRKPGNAAPPPTADATLDNVQRARTRARQRLIGALVLLSIGVVGFPLLFESQPRPIPVDIPIDIPAKEGAAPLAMPGQRAPGAGSAGVRPPDTVPEIITETRADAGRDVTPVEAPGAASSAVAAPAKPTPRVAGEPSTSAPPGRKAADNLPARPQPPAAAEAGEAARARALLEGKSPVAGSPSAATPPASAAEARFIVQVGAFADPAVAQETRTKVERLGIKTYTQVVDTPAGKRIRVRVGPFGGRADADRAMARVRAAGVQAAVLTL